MIDSYRVGQKSTVRRENALKNAHEITCKWQNVRRSSSVLQKAARTKKTQTLVQAKRKSREKQRPELNRHEILQSFHFRSEIIMILWNQLTRSSRCSEDSAVRKSLSAKWKYCKV